MAVDVDEPRRHGTARGVELGRLRLDRADGDDPPVRDPDVRDAPRRAGAVVDRPTADDEVERQTRFPSIVA
jgi:hypothetical protein